MIITCNCGEKKFTLPDNSIPATGRLVQCGYCGLKWKQFPVDEIIKTQAISRPKKAVSRPKPVQQKIQKPKKTKKSAVKKPREISLYSPEYLAKKHGIKIKEVKPFKKDNSINKEKKKISFGFYNSLLLLIVLVYYLSLFLLPYNSSQKRQIETEPNSLYHLFLLGCL